MLRYAKREAERMAPSSEGGYCFGQDAELQFLGHPPQELLV
jgi:hypothetical protein